ncbi:DUF4249 domain-containing protein [Pontibacter vulgaris]|uniref:DUF4249 domain-containing protein n=1 Tax=Pontibacter vulgaris TaxID=2905679 RepID=UPI001FA8188E|nr:DUF4249 domain-containing protein [Pontibacter vulgaris]
MKLLPFLLLMLVLAACIDPIDFKPEDQSEHLVVEAKLTNLPGTSYVRLMYAQPFSYPYNKFEEKAIIVITSQEGEQFEYAYSGGNGYYYPISDAVGLVGHTYTLHVTVNERQYQSRAVTIKQPVAIDSLYVEFGRESVIVEGRKYKEQLPGYQMKVDYTDPAGENNFYRWSFFSQYQVLTQPQDFIEMRCRGCPRPAPKPCCSHCWISERVDKFAVVTDRLTNGKKVINQKVFFVPFDRYMHIRYKLKVYQHTISEEAYEFFRVMEQQSGSTGTVFDPPPAEIKGNLFNINDENERVIGFFDASAASMKEIVINRSDIYFSFGHLVYPDDCRLMKGATDIRPSDW